MPRVTIEPTILDLAVLSLTTRPRKHDKFRFFRPYYVSFKQLVDVKKLFGPKTHLVFTIVGSKILCFRVIAFFSINSGQGHPVLYLKHCISCNILIEFHFSDNNMYGSANNMTNKATSTVHFTELKKSKKS